MLPVFVFLIIVPGCHWDDLWVRGFQICRGHISRLILVTPHVQGELHRTVDAEIRAVAISGRRCQEMQIKIVYRERL